MKISWCKIKKIDEWCQFTHYFICTILGKVVTSEKGIVLIDTKHEFPVIFVKGIRSPMNIIKKIYLLWRISITSSPYLTNPFSNINGITNILSNFSILYFFLSSAFATSIFILRFAKTDSIVSFIINSQQT